jgi:hypothetical protein
MTKETTPLVTDEQIDGRLDEYTYPYRREIGRVVREYRDIYEKHLAALSTIGGSGEPLAWVPEDELPASLPSEAYSALFPHSKVDFIRLFPIYGPSLSVDEVPTNEQIKDLAVECFDLGPEDIDAVLTFMCKLEDLRPEHDQRS